MATAYSTLHEFPLYPSASVRVSHTPQEGIAALEAMHIWRCTRPLEALEDGALVAACEDVEQFAECTPLERELVIRLGAAWENISRLEAAGAVLD